MHEYTVVDAFARQPLKGNPVAVFFDADDLTAETMQRIAREMNLSETTFVLPRNREGTRASASSHRSTNYRSPGIRCSARPSRSSGGSGWTICGWRRPWASYPWPSPKTAAR